MTAALVLGSQQENALQQSVCEQMCTCQGLCLPPVTYLLRAENYRRYLYGNGSTKALGQALLDYIADVQAGQR